MIPVENQEAMQILHYVNGQKYEPHHDFFHDPVNQAAARGGQRIATVLMYLTTPEEGGETVFPNAADKVFGDEWSDCAKRGLAVKARRGNALLFFSLHPDGTEDTTSLHGSCPTTKGEKWSATKWLRVLGCGFPAPPFTRRASPSPLPITDLPDLSIKDKSTPSLTATVSSWT